MDVAHGGGEVGDGRAELLMGVHHLVELRVLPLLTEVEVVGDEGRGEPPSPQ